LRPSSVVLLGLFVGASPIGAQTTKPDPFPAARITVVGTDYAFTQLLVDLRPEQRYLVICTLKNAPDSLPHAKLGMVMTFDVPSIAH
jgi:hypothetical protein